MYTKVICLLVKKKKDNQWDASKSEKQCLLGEDMVILEVL